MSKTVPEIEKWQSGSTELSSLSKILDNADTNLIRASYGPYQKRSYLKKSVFVKQWNFDALWRWGPKAQFSFFKKNLYGWNEQQKTRKPIFLTRKPTFFFTDECCATLNDPNGHSTVLAATGRNSTHRLICRQGGSGAWLWSRFISSKVMGILRVPDVLK